jgi:hypothetical protein
MQTAIESEAHAARILADGLRRLPDAPFVLWQSPITLELDAGALQITYRHIDIRHSPA